MIPSVAAIIIMPIIYSWDISGLKFHLLPYFSIITGIVAFRMENGNVDWSFFLILFVIVFMMHVGVLMEKRQK